MASVHEVRVRLLEQKDAKEVRRLIISRIFEEDIWRIAVRNVNEDRGIVAMSTASLLMRAKTSALWRSFLTEFIMSL